MVFPSVPVYLDPPNWNQAQAHPQQGSNTGGGDAQQQMPPPPVAQPHPEGGMPSSIRPTSMSERARLAKIPQPESALKCPRCDSTNTKFCYFNNYSLSQPRHFCKTCRRYWTRGGALRNVPVGGGCRRNKRSKSGGGSSSKSSATTAERQSGASSSSSTATTAQSGAIPSTLVPPPLPFMASLHSLSDFGAPSTGLSFPGFQTLDNIEYQVGSSPSMGLEQWRMQPIQQFPFLGGMETPSQVSGLFPFDGEGVRVEGMQHIGQIQAKASGPGLITQLASVKMEDTPQSLGLPRQYLGFPRPDQYWTGGGGGSSGTGSGSGGGGWTDLSGFNSSSSGNIL